MLRYCNVLRQDHKIHACLENVAKNPWLLTSLKFGRKCLKNGNKHFLSMICGAKPIDSGQSWLNVGFGWVNIEVQG